VARGKVGIGLGIPDDIDITTHTYLPPQRLPVEAHEIRVEDESLLVESLEKHHPDIRHSIRVHRRQRQAVWIVRLRLRGVVHPGGEQAEWLLGRGEVISC
jgi:hypothetical protein